MDENQHTHESSPREPTIDAKIKTLQQQFGAEFDKFDRDLQEFFEAHKQDEETFRQKETVTEWLQLVLQKRFKDCKLYMVGSSMSGLAGKSSDLDVCFISESTYNYAIHEATDHPLEDVHHGVAWDVLPKIMKVLESGASPDLYMGPTHQPCGGEPILKFFSEIRDREFEVDVSIFNSLAVYKAYLLHHYSRIDERFQVLCLVVKQWATACGIHDAMHRTFNSYTLVLLVLHFLQCGVKPAVLPNLQRLYPDFFNSRERPLDNLNFGEHLPSPLPETPRNEMSVGELLIRFFDYYAHVDFKNWAISVPGACLKPRSELRVDTAYYPIFVIDFYQKANMARTVSQEKFDKIFDAFRKTRDSLLGEPLTPPTLDIEL